jgi:hypothetical protein
LRSIAALNRLLQIDFHAAPAKPSREVLFSIPFPDLVLQGLCHFWKLPVFAIYFQESFPELVSVVAARQHDWYTWTLHMPATG